MILQLKPEAKRVYFEERRQVMLEEAAAWIDCLGFVMPYEEACKEQPYSTALAIKVETGAIASELLNHIDIDEEPPFMDCIGRIGIQGIIPARGAKHRGNEAKLLADELEGRELSPYRTNAGRLTLNALLQRARTFQETHPGHAYVAIPYKIGVGIVGVENRRLEPGATFVLSDVTLESGKVSWREVY